MDVSPEKIFEAAMRLAAHAKVRGNAAIRRVIGTGEWRSDPERLAAAKAKRERRRERAGGSSS